MACGSSYQGHPCPHPSLGLPQSCHSPERAPVVRTREAAFSVTTFSPQVCQGRAREQKGRPHRWPHLSSRISWAGTDGNQFLNGAKWWLCL